jgi:acetyltransferase
MTKLNTLFNPNKVAVVGATNDETKVGYALMKNILDGRTREVYPVTLSDAEVMGHVAYQSVSTIPGSVDLVVIAVRADVVANILEECGEKGITTAIVISAGFKEAGEEGVILEKNIADVARKHNITLLGPNCLGVMNAHAQWNASFAVNSPQKGGVGFVSQSGALGTALLDWANGEGVGFSKFVSLGNEASLTELDFLEYLADDEETKAVLLYVEKVTDGSRFLELARKVVEKKPLVVLRAGRSARGSVAVQSHTGSLAPSDAVFGSALRQVGAIPVDSLRTLFSLAKLFELGYTKSLNNLVILTNGGGPSVNTADLIGFSKSLSLVDFSDETKEALKAVLPPMAAVNNPIDVIGDAGPSRYRDTLDILQALDDVDGIIALVTPQMMTDPKDIADVFIEKKDGTPIIPVLMGGETTQKGARELIEHGMASFHSPTDVVEALDALARGTPKTTLSETGTAHASTRTMMGIHEMQTTLGSHGLKLEGVFVENKDSINGAVHELGDGPYVLKAVSRDVIHKSDMKAVQIGLADAEVIHTAWEEITREIEQHTEGATIDGMMLQQMVSGVECIIGMNRDPVFGPVIVFGLGGVFVEILKDASMRIAPITKEEALKQIQEIKGLPLLTGARGSEPVNLEALADITVSLSNLSLENSHIEEIDFNPVIVNKTGAYIVDARFMK